MVTYTQDRLFLYFRCNERTNPGCANPVTLDECMAIFRILQNEFYTEYKMYELETLAIALVFPIVSDSFNNTRQSNLIIITHYTADVS